MKVIEILKLGSEILKVLQESCIKVDDYKYVEMYEGVMVISPVTSEEQFMNTLVHEIDHLQTAICDYYDVEKGTEEAAYLQGYIMQRVFRTLR